MVTGGGGAFTPSPPPGPPANIGQSLTKQGVVIAPGGGGWKDALVESPAVFLDAATGLYVMVAVGYDTGTIHASIGAFTAVTPDGPWTEYGQILAGSGSGADSDGCSGPFVWLEAGTYHLFYIGLTASGYEGGTKTLCHATSTDWVPGTNAGTWTRHGTIVGPTSGWRSAAIWHPCVVKRGSTYYLFFNANGADEAIGYATSSDLSTWTVDDANSPILPPVGSENRTGDPSVYQVGTVWWMAFYTLLSGASDGLASTTDASFPLGWTRYAGNPILVPSASYDSTYAHKPFILIAGSRYYHWYTAVGSGGRQIALATEDF